MLDIFTQSLLLNHWKFPFLCILGTFSKQSPHPCNVTWFVTSLSIKGCEMPFFYFFGILSKAEVLQQSMRMFLFFKTTLFFLGKFHIHAGQKSLKVWWNVSRKLGIIVVTSFFFNPPPPHLLVLLIPYLIFLLCLHVVYMINSQNTESYWMSSSSYPKTGLQGGLRTQ